MQKKSGNENMVAARRQSVQKSNEGAELTKNNAVMNQQDEQDYSVTEIQKRLGQGIESARAQIIQNIQKFKYTGDLSNDAYGIADANADLIKTSLKDSVAADGGVKLGNPSLNTIQVTIEDTQKDDSFTENYTYDRAPFGNVKWPGESVYLKGTAPFPITEGQVVPGAEGGVWPMMAESIHGPAGSNYQIRFIIIAQIGPSF